MHEYGGVFCNSANSLENRKFTEQEKKRHGPKLELQELGSSPWALGPAGEEEAQAVQIWGGRWLGRRAGRCWAGPTRTLEELVLLPPDAEDAGHGGAGGGGNGFRQGRRPGMAGTDGNGWIRAWGPRIRRDLRTRRPAMRFSSGGGGVSCGEREI